MEIALEAGADDVARDGDKFEVTCDPDIFSDVAARPWTRPASKPEAKQITRLPKNTVDLDVHDRQEGAQTPGIASTITTTCRTSRPTSTSPRRPWPNWSEADGRGDFSPGEI